MHDHPEMIVSSKILMGEVVRYSMDKIHPVTSEGLPIPNYGSQSTDNYK